MSRKKNRIFHLTALTTMFVMTLSSCAKSLDTSNSSSQENGSFDDSKYELKDVIFEDLEVSYDGRLHSVLAQNVPSDIVVTYENNTGRETGTYNAIAHFRSKDGRIHYKSKQAKLIILSDGNKSDVNFAKVRMNDLEADYDGLKHTAKLANPEDIPTGFHAVYSNNTKINAGKYVARCDLVNDATGAIHFSIFSNITIHKATYDMSGVTFPSQTFPYVEGTIRRIEIQGKLPSDKITVIYTNNTARSAGSVTKAIATFKSLDDNYEDPKPMEATLTISSNATCTVTINYYLDRSKKNLYSTSVLSKKYGDVLTENDIEKRVGYSYSTARPISDYNINSTSLTVDVFYTPITYEASFAIEHGVKSSVKYNINDSWTLSNPTMDAGYEFVGWFFDKDYTIPATTLLGKTGDLIIYGQTKEISSSESFVLRNVSYKWDSTEKEITTVGALSSTRTVTYTYEKVDGIDSELLDSLPKDVGTYKVTGHFHNKISDTEYDPSDIYTQVAYLVIEKNSLDTSSMKFQVSQNSNEVYADRLDYPKVTGIDENISYMDRGSEKYVNFRVNTEYTFYDDNFNKLNTSPTTEGIYYVKASFNITDLLGNDASDKLLPIDPVYTSFKIVKRSYDISDIKFVDKTVSINNVPDEGCILEASGSIIEENGKYYTSDRKLVITYSNNKISKGDVGTLTACMTFSWSNTATEEDKRRYNLPSPMYATLSVVTEGTSTVIFQTEDGTHLMQTEVTTGSSVAAPKFPTDLTDPNEEYYWDADVGNQNSSIDSVRMNTVFTLKKRYKTYKVIVSGYYQDNDGLHYNVDVPLRTFSYSKGDTKGLKDIMDNFSRGYEFLKFQIAKKSAFNDEYYADSTKFDSSKDIYPTDLTKYGASFYDLYALLYPNDTLRESLVVRIVSVAKSINVEYDLDSGTITGDLEQFKKQTFGQKYKLPTAIPTRTNMKFVGWQVNSNFIASSVLCDLTPQEKPYIIKAIYKDDNHFTTSFIKNNGDASTINEITTDDAIYLPDNDPSLYGYNFIGWKIVGATLNEDGEPLKDNEVVYLKKGNYFNSEFFEKYFGSQTLTSLVFEATYQEVDVTLRLYSYQYDNDGNLVIYKDIQTKYGANLMNLLPKDARGNLLYPENLGSEFSYWSYNGNRVLTDSVLLKFTTINGINYAELSPIYDTNDFSIVYDLNYASSSTTVQYVKGGETYTLTTSPKRTGYKFDYWYIEGEVDQDGNPLNFIDSHYNPENGMYNFKKNIILKAHWTLKSYQVSFYNKNNLTNWTDTKFYQYGTLIDANHGWITDEGIYDVLKFSKDVNLIFTDSTGKVLEEGSPLLFDSDTDTIYTIYVLTTNNTFLVTYNVDSTTAVTYQRVETNTDFTLLVAPSKPGMEFKCWYYYSGDSTVEITTSTFRLPLNRDLVLYARFKPIEYSIRYLTTTGFEIHAETTVTFGQAFSLPNASEIHLNGYNFVSWLDEKGNPVNSDTLLTSLPSDSKAIVLYANLDPATYYITYDSNNNKDVPHSETAKYNQSFHLYADPTRDGYSFAGWSFYDSDTNSLISGETANLLKQGTFAYAGNVRARAVWIGITYDVKFTFDGVKVIKDKDGKDALEEKLTKLTYTMKVALGNNINVLYDGDLFTDKITIDGEEYSCYTIGEEKYVNPVGLYYDNLDLWKESASNVGVKNNKGSKYILSVVGGTEFTANYKNKVQAFTFLLKKTDAFGITSQIVIHSENYTFGQNITLPDYPPDHMYDFYGWTNEENHKYDPKTEGPDSNYPYTAGKVIKYDVAFDRYASKNKFILNLIMDSKKAYYIISLDGVKYLKVNPDSEISETDDVYTAGLTSEDKKIAMSDDVIGKVDKGTSITLPNVAKNLNNNYYKPITVDGVKFYPCDRTIYKVGSEYLLDGTVYNIGITGTNDNPEVLEAFSCYVAGEYRNNQNGESFSDFMIMRDTDSAGISFVNGYGESLTSLSEVAFCGFTNRNGAKAYKVETTTTNGHGDFYIPPFYFDGSRAKKVSMIAYGNMNDGAFSGINFDRKTNIHIPTTIQTILADSFSNIAIVDEDKGTDGHDSYTSSDYDSGLVFGKVIYEGSLKEYRDSVTVYDTNIKSSKPSNPMWCYNSEQGVYTKDVNYSVITWYRNHADSIEHANSEFMANRNKINETLMYIQDDSSITLNFFYGTKEEYIDYCKLHYTDNNGTHLNRNDSSNRYVACFNKTPDVNDLTSFYPEILYVGDAKGNYNLESLQKTYSSKDELLTYNILGQRISYVTNLETKETDSIYLIDPDTVVTSYDSLLDASGQQLSADHINILNKISLTAKQTIYYNRELGEYLTLTKGNHPSLDAGKVVYIKKDMKTGNASDNIAIKVYDGLTDSTTINNAANKLYSDYQDQFVYFLNGGDELNNAYLYYLGSINNIMTSETNKNIANAQKSFSNMLIYAKESYGPTKAMPFFYGNYNEYISKMEEKGLTLTNILDKSVLTTLTDDNLSTTFAYLGTRDDFKTSYFSVNATYGKQVFRAMLNTNLKTAPYYLYSGDGQDFVKNYYGEYVSNYVSTYTNTDKGDIVIDQDIFVGLASTLFEQSKITDSNIQLIYSQLFNNTGNAIYTYASANNGTITYPVVAGNVSTDSIRKMVYSMLTKNSETKIIVYTYLEDNDKLVSKPSSTNFNLFLPTTNDSYSEVLSVGNDDRRYQTFMSKEGFIYIDQTNQNIGYLGTASSFYSNQKNNLTKYENFKSSNTTGSNFVNTILLNDRTNPVLVKYYLAVAKDDASETSDIIYKTYNSTTDKSPVDRVNKVYSDAQEEINKANYKNYYDNKLVYCLLSSNKIGDNFFNGSASSYFSSSYININFDNPYLQKLKDSTYMYVGNVKDMSVTLVNDDNFKNNQIYAILKPQSDSDSNTLVTYFKGTAQEYKDAEESTLLENSNNFVIFGSKDTANYTSNLLLKSYSQTLDSILLDNFKDTTAYIIDSKTTITNTSFSKEDNDHQNSSNTNVINNLLTFYVGTLKEFNTKNSISSISNYKSKNLGDYIYTLDNLSKGSRNLIAAFYLNYADIIKSEYFTEKTTTEQISSDNIKIVTVSTTIGGKYWHFAFSDLKDKGFVSNVGTFDENNNLNGVENDYLLYVNAFDQEIDVKETLYVQASKTLDTGEISTINIDDAFIVIKSKYNVADTLAMKYNGIYYTNDDGQSTTQREINSVISDYVYFDPTSDGYTIVDSSLQYHQKIDTSKNDFRTIEFNHTNKNSTDNQLTSDIAYFYAGTKTDLENKSNNIPEYRKLYFFTINVNYDSTKDPDSVQDLYWNDYTDPDTQQFKVGGKYSVFVYNDDKNKIVRAYAS